MKGLRSKVILVCGGATGIGAATARRLCEEGALVGIGDINFDGASTLAAQLRDSGYDAMAWFYDQGEEATIVDLVESAINHFGRLDGLIANAADLKTVLIDKDVLNNSSEIWNRTLQVNVTGVSCLFRAALPQMLKQGSGTLLVTSSAASVVGEPERPAYAASKAAVNAICRHVASKWGKQGIRCNAIAPGLVMTEQLEQNLDEATRDWMLKGSRSTRHGAPADIAGAAAFLFSDDGEWVNGQTWHVNGGVSLAN